jgi:hypothetical protein
VQFRVHVIHRAQRCLRSAESVIEAKDRH